MAAAKARRPLPWLNIIGLGVLAIVAALFVHKLTQIAADWRAVDAPARTGKPAPREPRFEPLPDLPPEDGYVTPEEVITPVAEDPAVVEPPPTLEAPDPIGELIAPAPAPAEPAPAPAPAQ